MEEWGWFPDRYLDRYRYEAGDDDHDNDHHGEGISRPPAGAGSRRQDAKMKNERIVNGLPG